MTELIWAIFTFAYGACVGSFLNVVIYRLPRGQSIVFPGSRCPSCGRGISWYDNIPLLSWLVLRARCRNCKAPISPRYFIIELATAVLVCGLYLSYYVAGVRQNAGPFMQSWPMFIAHAALLCGLLACSVVDIEYWIVLPEVMWICAGLGVASAAYSPHPFLPHVSSGAIAVAFGGMVGLGVSMLLVRWGFIQESFLDAEEPKVSRPLSDDSARDKKPITSVAFTSAHGVNVRLEILRELLQLLPAIVLGAAAGIIVNYVPAASKFWLGLFDQQVHPLLAPRFQSVGSAVLGFIVGGGLVWGIRILGTLAFGKEAMGRGDVDILAAVGAVTGWIVPTLAFFLAPFLGLLWALYLWLGRNQKELPYGPWLAAGSLAAMLAYDRLALIIKQYESVFCMYK